MVVSVKGTYTVKPEMESPECVFYLSEIDHIISLTHTPILYFYRSPSAEFPLHIIRNSLSKTLSIFYPLAGRLRWVAGPTTHRLEINCNSAGVFLVEAESTSSIDDFGDFCPTATLQELLPPIDYKLTPIHQQPLLLVQLTKFSGCGISLGLRFSHVAGDGTSLSHFVSEWTRIARGEEPRNSPFLDRTILKPPEGASPPSFDHSDLKTMPLIIGHADDSVERRKETTPELFTLSKHQVEALRNEANVNRKPSTRPFTRFEVVSGHVWRNLTKARCLQNEQQTLLRVSVNFRNRTKPNLPKFYFGNGIVPVVATSTAGELAAEPLSYACGRLREAINRVNDEYVKSLLSYLRNEKDFESYRHWHVVGCEEGPFFGNPCVSITSWLTLGLGDADFGWGKAIHMGPGLLGYDGKSYILPGHDGSLVVALRLQVAHMDHFKKFFYGDVPRYRL